MYRPELYARVNFFERNDSKEIFEEFEDKLKWKQNTGDTLLDIGCGPGDVTIDFILPALSNTFKKLVACDISPNMIDYAKRTYGNLDSRIHFELKDIESEDLKITEQFDHVTSMFCFHFVGNKRFVHLLLCSESKLQGVENIYNLVKPGGDTVILFLSTIGFYDIWGKMSQLPKWAPYMTDVSRLTERSQNPVGEFKEYLEDAGFKNIFIESRDKFFHLTNWKDFRDFVHSVDGYAERTPFTMDEFLDDFVDETRKIKFVEEKDAQVNINIPYKLIVVYADKK